MAAAQRHIAQKKHQWRGARRISNEQRRHGGNEIVIAHLSALRQRYIAYIARAARSSVISMTAL